MNLTRFYLNVLSVNPVDQYKITKAKKAYIKNHSECAICGNQKNLEVHHIQPVHINLTLACDYNNFTVLCDTGNNGCHRWIGHFGDFKNTWNLNVREYAIATRLFLIKMQPTRKFLVSTDDLIKEFATALNISNEQFLERVSIFNK